MADAIPLVLKLQSDALDSDVPVSNLLRTAKVVATKLEQKSALVWINHELNGYSNFKLKNLPEYRQLVGRPKFLNPHVGWLPILFRESRVGELFSRAPIAQSIAAIEASIGKKHDSEFQYQYAPEVRTELVKLIGVDANVTLFLTFGQFWGLIESVRNFIQEWGLGLETAGILGEHMTFTAAEKREAGTVTNKYIIQNVGVLGDVSGQAKIKNKQTAVIALDLEQVRSFLDQAKGAVALLPAEVREKVAPELAALEGELKGKAPDQSRLRKVLTSIRTACEGTAGNLAAEGIVRLLAAIF